MSQRDISYLRPLVGLEEKLKFTRVRAEAKIGTKTNESYLQMIVKYNPTHKFSVTPPRNENMWPPAIPRERSERLVQGPHVNLKTWGQGDQMRVDEPNGKHK